MGLECLSSLFLFQDFAQVQFLYAACPNFHLQESQGKLCREAGLGQSQWLLLALTSSVPPLFQCRLPGLPGMKESSKKCSRLKECSVSDIPLWPWGWGGEGAGISLAVPGNLTGIYLLPSPHTGSYRAWGQTPASPYILPSLSFCTCTQAPNSSNACLLRTFDKTRK